MSGLLLSLGLSGGESDPVGSGSSGVSAAFIKSVMLAIMPNADSDDVDDFAPAIASAMSAYEINTQQRQLMFLAQAAEESNELWHLHDHYKTPVGEEYASGAAYEERTDLGNTPEDDGDGPLYKGRGLLQITGRDNYEDVGNALGIDLVSSPQLLDEPKWSALSACRYWQSHGCNELADANDFVTITRRINGGVNGLAQRQAYLSAAQAAVAGDVTS